MDIISGGDLAWFVATLLLGLIILAVLWPSLFQKEAADQSESSCGDAIASRQGERERPPAPEHTEAPSAQLAGPCNEPKSVPLGPPLCRDHQLWLLRLQAVQRFMSEANDCNERDKIKRHIWRCLDDRPSVIATGCSDGQARIFSLESPGKPLVSVRHDATNRDPLYSVSLTHGANGPRLLKGSWDGRWHEWESWPARPARPAEFLRGEPGVGHDNQVTALALSRDGNYLACACSAGKVLVYRRNCPTREIELLDFDDVMELKDSLKLGDHGEFVVQRRLELADGSVVVEPQDQLLPEASLEGFKRRSELDDVELPARFRFRFVGCMTQGFRRAWRSLDHDAAVLCMILTAEGSSEVLYSGSRDRQIRKWSLQDGNLLAKYTGHSSMVRCLAVNSYLASGSDDRSIRVWRRDATECVRVIAAHKDFVRSIAWCNVFAERMVSAGDDRAITLWNTETGEMLRQYPQDSPAVAVLLAGSRLAAACEDGRMRIYDTESTALLHTVKHPQRLASLAWLRVNLS